MKSLNVGFSNTEWLDMKSARAYLAKRAGVKKMTWKDFIILKCLRGLK